MLNKKPAIEVEWQRLLKSEAKYLSKRQEEKKSILNEKLEDKVPDKLKETLEKVFEKAFGVVFEKGVGIIEKTYNREEIEKTYKVQQFEADLRNDRKSLNAMRRKANQVGIGNLVLTSLSGIGMGALGIGIPDIPIFIGMVLKNIYEIALHYGYSYDTEDEQYFILMIIEGAVSNGKHLIEINEKLNTFIQTEKRDSAVSIKENIKSAANVLSRELLYMKFLQGIPVIGIIGGSFDALYMKQISEYAKLKYRYRYLFGQKR